jgi:amino acid transporter
VLTASFLVPTDHPFINGEGQSTGSRSIFIIAVVEAGLPTLAQFFNAMFLFSAATCAADNLYVASRVLHTLALRDQTGPEWITRRLRQCRAGVPMRAVLLSAAVMLIAYLGPTGATGAVSRTRPHGRIISNSSNRDSTSFHPIVLCHSWLFTPLSVRPTYASTNRKDPDTTAIPQLKQEY